MLLSTMRAPLQPTSGQFLPACAASDSPLSRAERAGVIDALLVVVAVVQYFAIERYFRQTGQPLFTPVGRLPAWLIAPATATWTLLTAGALAPLLRRRAARRWRASGTFCRQPHQGSVCCFFQEVFPH